MKNKTFFVSEDINLILNGKSCFGNFYKENGLKMPKISCIENLRTRMYDSLKKATNTNLEVIKEQDMLTAMNYLAKTSRNILLSLDEIYLKDNANVSSYINLTRLNIDDKGNTMLATRTKNGLYIPFEAEVMRVSKLLKEQYSTSKLDISIIDDVVYSGDAICTIIKEFSKYNISVREVLSAICVKDSIEKVESCGAEVISAYTISDVYDEICERDFYFGISQSGRNLLSDEGKIIKQPYFYPYGMPVESASIPLECAREFSINCLENSKLLWKEIESQSNKVITSDDLPEQIYNTPTTFEVVKELSIAEENLMEQ